MREAALALVVAAKDRASATHWPQAQSRLSFAYDLGRVLNHYVVEL
jgi:hypothetical protein